MLFRDEIESSSNIVRYANGLIRRPDSRECIYTLENRRTGISFILRANPVNGTHPWIIFGAYNCHKYTLRVDGDVNSLGYRVVRRADTSTEVRNMYNFEMTLNLEQRLLDGMSGQTFPTGIFLGLFNISNVGRISDRNPQLVNPRQGLRITLPLLGISYADFLVMHSSQQETLEAILNPHFTAVMANQMAVTRTMEAVSRFHILNSAHFTDRSTYVADANSFTLDDFTEVLRPLNVANRSASAFGLGTTHEGKDMGVIATGIGFGGYSQPADLTQLGRAPASLQNAVQNYVTNNDPERDATYVRGIAEALREGNRNDDWGRIIDRSINDLNRFVPHIDPRILEKAHDEIRRIHEQNRREEDEARAAEERELRRIEALEGTRTIEEDGGDGFKF